MMDDQISLNGNTTRIAELRALFLHERDLRAALPHYPRLAPEYLRVPMGPERILLYGPKDPIVIKSRRGSLVLSKLLERLDGATAIAEIVNRLDDVNMAALFDVIIALTRAGSLEDGSPTVNSSDPIHGYFGRFATAAGTNRNRSEALSRLAAARLLVAVTGLDPTDLIASLEAVPLGHITSGSSKDGDLDGATHALFIANGDMKALQETIFAAHDAGIPYMCVRMGAHEVDFGPFVLPNITAGYDCLTHTLAAPSGAADHLRSQLWGHQAAHIIIGILSSITGHSYLNQVQRISDTLGAPRDLHRIPIVPGSRTSTLASDPAYYDNEALQRVWLHHMGTRKPPRSLLSPHSHFHHFTAANVALTRSPARRFFGHETIQLPDHPVPDSLPWLSGNIEKRPNVPLDLAKLATILKRTAGYLEFNEGQRRIAPTGGGLGSPSLFLSVRDLPGIPDGGYRYFGPDHVLEPLPHLDWEAANDVASATPAKVRVFNVAWFGKVRAKYSDFGYSIVHYDAGVALAYAQICCAALNVQLIEEPLAPLPTIARSFGLMAPTRDYLPTSVFRLGEGLNGGGEETVEPLEQLIEFNEPNRDVERPKAAITALSGKLAAYSSGVSLESALTTRRSTNTFIDGTVPGEIVFDLMCVAHNALVASAQQGGLHLGLWPLLLRRRGDTLLPAGIYAATGPERQDWSVRAKDLNADWLTDCINQIGLATASDIIVMIGDLSQAVSRYGTAGYRGLLLGAGRVVGNLWLAAHAAGLKGTAAGGVLEPGLSELAHCDGYRECPLLSFALGPATRDA